MSDPIQAVTDYYLSPIVPLLRAIVQAEGGQRAYVRAIRCSFPGCKNYTEALARGAKTIRNRMVAYCEFCGGNGGSALGHMFRADPLDATDPFTGEVHPKRLVFSDDFIRFLGAKWAPVGAENDPTGLNVNWIPNVCALYRQAIRAVPV